MLTCFKAYDIRGKLGVELNEDIAYRKRFTEEFKLEAIKQITERHYSAAEVSARLGVSTHSLYAWIKKYDLEN
jgi:transposase-like protein